MLTCLKCSRPIPSDARFCVECGQPVATPKAGLTCPKCQASLPEGSNFCIACGHNLQASSPISTAPPSKTSRRGSWGRYMGLGMVGLVGALLIGRGMLGPRSATPTPGVSASVSPISTPTSQAVAVADLGQLVDTWSVDPDDPAFIANSKEANELILERQGTEVRGQGPDNTPFRFWAEGDKIVGEARDPGGKLHSIDWVWVEAGQKARLQVPAEGESLLLRRGPVTIATPTPTPPETVILYQADQDLNGDQQAESVQVIALDNNPDANAPSKKILRIYGADGSLQFASETFEEPFHTDLDSLAESPEEKAGLRILPGSKYPRIRLIFATRSGNFVDFQFDGRNYVLAEVGD